MVWERTKIIASLTGKGFELRDDRDHFVLVFAGVGLRRAIFTKLSRGSKYKVYGDKLLSDMSHQLKITRKQLDALIECPMQESDYTKVLKDQGLIANPSTAP